jgi:hypothetical protein
MDQFRNFVVRGVEEWKGDESFNQSTKGLGVQHLIFQEMHLGWEQHVSKERACEMGGMPEPILHLIKCNHIVTFDWGDCLYRTNILSSTPHYSYPGIDEILETVNDYNNKGTNSGGYHVFIQCAIYTSKSSCVHDGGFLKVIYSGTREWTTIECIFNKLGMDAIFEKVLAHNSNVSDRGNIQYSVGYTNQSYGKTKENPRISKPNILTKTTHDDVAQMAIMSHIMDIVDGEGVNFPDRERTKKFGNELAKKFNYTGPYSDNISCEAKTNAVIYHNNPLYCHFDRGNDYIDGYDFASYRCVPHQDSEAWQEREEVDGCPGSTDCLHPYCCLPLP